MNTIIISEEQDRLIRQSLYEDVSEILDINAGIGNTSGINYNITPTKGVNKTLLPIEQAVNKTTVTDLMNKSNTNSVSTDGTVGDTKGKFTVTKDEVKESLLLSKRQIDKYRLRKLKENSTVTTIKDFLG